MKNRNLTKTEICIALLALAIPSMILAVSMYNRRQHHQGHEPSAIASLKAIRNAQFEFIKQDHYEIGTNVYANPQNGNGISDLYKLGYNGESETANAHKYMDKTIANADDSLSNPVPKNGYLIRDLKCDDYTKQFAALAYPHCYEVKISYLFLKDYGGRNIFVINESGIIYQIGARELYPDIKEGDPIPMTMTEYPKDISKWTEAGK